MSTKASIQVNTDPAKTLKCAYETLLSMETSKKSSDRFHRINEKHLFASMNGNFKINESRLSWHISSLVTVEKLDNSHCRLSIVSDLHSTVAENNGIVVNFISDFLEKFSQNLTS